MKTNTKSCLACLSLATAVIPFAFIASASAAQPVAPTANGTSPGFAPGIVPPTNASPSLRTTSLDRKAPQPLTPTVNPNATSLSFGPGISRSPNPANATSSPNSAASSDGTPPAGGGHPGLSLYLNDEFVADLNSAEGGDEVAEIVVAANQTKHVSNIKVEPLVIQVSPARVSKLLFGWLADTVAGTATPKDGTISLEGYTKAISRLTFHSSVITEIQFPALDAASKTLPAITVTIQPEYTRRTIYDGKVGYAAPASGLPGSFRVEIPSLECVRVHKVPALVFKRNYSTGSIGVARTYANQPTTATISNLALIVPTTAVATYQTWFENFLKGDREEKQGSLHFLNSNLEEVFTLNLSHLGIVRLGLEGAPTAELVPLCRVEMYCGGMSLSAGPKLGQMRLAAELGAR
ncbi:MAG TPA: hypothetical protein VLT36_25240 [Candidatus Dormibacteraeota bacterium]|nr:hypothetical protein [Candidatus Dormibacteraeota bacterium]